jgi:predicted nucleic acid-binding protein
MTNKYLIDSSAWIEYLKGTALGEKIKSIVEKEKIATCVLSIAELSDKFARENESFDKLSAFIRNKSAIISLTYAVCLESGKLKAAQRPVKKEFSLADAIIYLTAIDNGCILITKDNDFKGMEKIILLE